MRIREVKEEQRTRFSHMPMAFLGSLLIAVGWTAHTALKRTRFRRTAQLARRVENAGKRAYTLASEYETHALDRQDETAA
ncbi:MAG: hypothetical protein AMXMBFR44_1470 [Candidatus Campbellbacteria bacterium]